MSATGNELVKLSQLKGTVDAIKDKIDGVEGNIPAVIDNTTSTATDSALSANQGKILQGQIDNLKNIGRFLAIWNATTGVPTSNPEESPYAYRTGDYFRIGVVGNRIPTGSQYVIGGTNYTTTTDTLSIGDVYYYDGTSWNRQASSGGGTVQDVQVDGTSVLSGGIANIDLSGKLDKVTTAGASRLYCVNSAGEQRMVSYSSSANATTIAYRQSNGALKVGTPVANDDATTKSYVDNHHDSTKANDSAVVHKTGEETIQDHKIFSRTINGVTNQLSLNETQWDIFTCRDTTNPENKTAIAKGYVWCQDQNGDRYSQFKPEGIYYGKDSAGYEVDVAFPTDKSGSQTFAMVSDLPDISGKVNKSGDTMSGNLEWASDQTDKWLLPYLLAFKNADTSANPTYPYTGFYQWGDEWQVNARDVNNQWKHNLFTINNSTKVPTFFARPIVSGSGGVALQSEIPTMPHLYRHHLDLRISYDNLVFVGRYFVSIIDEDATSITKSTILTRLKNKHFIMTGQTVVNGVKEIPAYGKGTTSYISFEYTDSSSTSIFTDRIYATNTSDYYFVAAMSDNVDQIF